MKLLSIIVDSSMIDRLLVKSSLFVRYGRKKWKCSHTLHQGIYRLQDSGEKYCATFLL